MAQATEERARRDDLLSQLAALQDQQNWSAAERATGPSSQRTSQINSLQTQITGLTKAIDAIEKPAASPEARPRAPSPTPSHTAQDILQYDANGNVIGITPNPNFYRQVQTVEVPTSGKTLVIMPPTAEQLAQDPNAQPQVIVGYTDQEAAALAQREQANRDAQVASQVASQRVADLVNQTRAEIEQAVARGEDAASIRANRQLDIQEAWNEAQVANQKAQTAQAALNDYNTNRHLQAQEQLTAQQIQATKDQQAALDAVTQRGQEINSADTTYSTQANMANQRLNAATSFSNNALNTFGQMNRDAPPG